MVNKCKYCGAELPEGRNFCLACGRMQSSRPVDVTVPRRRRWYLPLAALLLAAVVACSPLLLHRQPHAEGLSHEREAAGEEIDPGAENGNDPAGEVMNTAVVPPEEPVSPENGETAENGGQTEDPGTEDPAEEQQSGETVTDPVTPPTQNDAPEEPTPAVTPTPTPEPKTEPEPRPEPEPDPEPEPAPEPEPEPAPDVPQANITLQPTHQAVVVNDTATFAIRADRSDVTYQWQYAMPVYGELHVSVPEWQDIPAGTDGCSGINTAELKVKATAARNGCMYRCGVTNSGGTAWSDGVSLYSCDRRLGSGLYWTMLGPKEVLGYNKTVAFAGTGAIPDFSWDAEEDGNASPWLRITNLERVILAPGVTGIGSCAFADCYYLHELILPETLTYIGEDAFAYCFTAWEGNERYTVTIPAGVQTIGKYAFANCKALTAIRVESGNGKYRSVDGVLYNRSKTELIQVPCGFQGTLTIPDTVKTIKRGALSNCKGITGVVFPDALTTIERAAFERCKGLTEITIPRGIREIASETFFGCENLSEVTIPDSVETIGAEAFRYCKYLNIVHLGSGVKSVADNAFNGCSILTDVYYSGTEASWAEVAVGSGNKVLVNAAIHFGK